VNRHFLALLLLLSFLFSGCSKSTKGGSPMGLKEVSANFDLKNVEPFLQRIPPHIERGFAQEQVSEIIRSMGQLKREQEMKLKFPIQFQGVSTILEVQIVMDDLDSPNLYLFTAPPLADELQGEMQKFFQENGL
jgi:hypothetical protein